MPSYIQSTWDKRYDTIYTQELEKIVEILKQEHFP